MISTVSSGSRPVAGATGSDPRTSASYSSSSVPSGVIPTTVAMAGSRSATAAISGRNSSPTISSLASLSFSTYSNSAPANRKLTTTVAAPSEAAAIVSSTPAGWFLSRNATVSPAAMPRCCSAPASRRIRACHWAQVQVRPR